MTARDGTEIWRRGGRVEKLPLHQLDQCTAAGALQEAAKKLRSSAASLRTAAESDLARAAEKDKQAEELEAAVRKLENGNDH